MQDRQDLAGKSTICVRDALQLQVLQRATVVAGGRGLNRRIRWVHVVDTPEIAPWLNGGELLLTTGYGWSRDPTVQRRTIRDLNALPLAAILFDTGNFYDKVPPVLRREADRLGLPVLAAPHDLKFIDITEAVNRAILDRQYAHLSQLEQIHRKLTRAAVEAENLQDLAKVLAELIGKSVTIEDAEFRLLSYARVDDLQDPARLETIRDTQTPDRVLRLLDRKGFMRILRTESGPVRIPPFPEAGMREGRVVCPIRTATDLLGYVWILEGNIPVSEMDLRAAEQTATLAALLIMRQHAVAVVEDRVRYTFVDALIRGELDQSPGMRERAQLWGFDLSAPYIAGILTIAPSPERGRRWALAGPEDFELRERVARQVRAVLEGHGHVPFLTLRLNQIVFLVPATGGWQSVRPFVERLWQALRVHEPHLPLILTLSDIRPGAAGALSYWEADKLTDVAPMEGVYFYHEHHLTQLLHASDKAILGKMWADTMSVWGAREDRPELMDTLITLLRTGFRVNATARMLGIHRNTVRQRLARIRQVHHAPLDDPKFWARLVLAMEAEKHGLVGMPKASE